MTSEIIDPIAAAIDINESGRWSALNNNIANMANNINESESWKVTLYSRLTYRMFEEYLSIKDCFEDKKTSISQISWHARNLLEISIWSGYCAKSDDNARKFYEDAGRDVKDVMKNLISWGEKTNQTNDWVIMLDHGSNKLNAMATKFGIRNIDSKYTDVRKAAEELDIAKHYSVAYKMLSKFTHPTAMQIIGDFDSKTTKKLKNLFYSNGCTYFIGAFHYLEKYLKQYK